MDRHEPGSVQVAVHARNRRESEDGQPHVRDHGRDHVRVHDRGLVHARVHGHDSNHLDRAVPSWEYEAAAVAVHRMHSTHSDGKVVRVQPDDTDNVPIPIGASMAVDRNHARRVAVAEAAEQDQVGEHRTRCGVAGDSARAKDAGVRADEEGKDTDRRHDSGDCHGCAA